VTNSISEKFDSGRRFKPPWTSERIPGGYVVKDATGQSLAYVYARETIGTQYDLRADRRPDMGMGTCGGRRDNEHNSPTKNAKLTIGAQCHLPDSSRGYPENLLKLSGLLGNSIAGRGISPRSITHHAVGALGTDLI
jgi:hypothetical protein